MYQNNHFQVLLGEAHPTIAYITGRGNSPYTTLHSLHSIACYTTPKIRGNIIGPNILLATLSTDDITRRKQ